MEKKEYFHNPTACHESCLNFDVKHCGHCQEIVKRLLFFSTEKIWSLFDEITDQSEYSNGTKHGLLLAISAFTKEDSINDIL
jgi:hypothetical protein